MKLTSNEYLDRRKPEWIDAEKAGRVYFDRVTGLVHIEDGEIIALREPEPHFAGSVEVPA